MNLGRIPQLFQLDARTWCAPLVLALVLVAVQVLGMPAREALPYDRAAILVRGDYWRLVTAHLVHFDLAHLAWNLAGLALVAWLFAREFDLRDWIVILVAATITVDLGFLLLEPQLEWYVGFSGVLHGLMAAGLCAWLWRKPDALTALVAVLFALKLGREHCMGALPFTASTLAIAVIHEAHTYGAIGGGAAALWMLWRRRRAVPSL